MPKAIKLTAFGETHNLRGWARKIGISSGALRARLGRLNWPLDLALSAPAGTSFAVNAHGFGEDARNYRHGHAALQTPEYHTWMAIRRRCNDPKGRGYEKYGAKGIIVCVRWDKSFEDFLADMGPRPSSRHSIDRINVYGDYEPTNCRWADPIQQANNKRNSRFIEWNGKRQTTAQWARETGLSTSLIHQRMRLGFSAETALSAPPFKIGRSK